MEWQMLLSLAIIVTCIMTLYRVFLSNMLARIAILKELKNRHLPLKDRVYIQNNYMDIISKTVLNIIESSGIKAQSTEYSIRLYYNMGKKLNARVGARKNKIELTNGWAIKILFEYSSEVTTALSGTIGHELTHLEGDYKSKTNKQFASWVSEVHADFGGCQKMLESKRNSLLVSLQFKKTEKEQHGRIDISSETHPSWEQRIYYATNCNFDEELLRKIAYDVQNRNGKKRRRIKNSEINKAMSFYTEIILKDNLI